MSSPDSTAIAEHIQTILSKIGTKSFAESQRRFALRGNGVFLGVQMPDVRTVAKRSFLELPDHTIATVHLHCEALFKRNIYELKTVAIQWASLCSPQTSEWHIGTYEEWLRTYIDEWMDCDDFCTHPVAALLAKYPEALHIVKAWATDENWVLRRAAAVSLVPSARKGMYIDHILDIAELLHKDSDRLVQKGTAWLLRVARKCHEGAIDSFMEEYKRTMSPVLTREALKR